MKKIFVFAASVAAGVSSIHAQYTPGLTTIESAKWWTLSGSLRGFYDDNYTTSPSKIARSSFGFELSPSAAINFNPNESTLLSASYVYDMRWFADRTNNTADHTHQFNAKLDHAFSERYKLQANESFVIAQEPQVLDPSGTTTTPLRTDGNNIRNTGSVDFTADLLQNFGVEAGYANKIYDYQQQGEGSRSALLDRIEQLASANLRWRIVPETVAVVGYQYGLVDFTRTDSIIVGAGLPPSARDVRVHYFLAGADHNFNEQLIGSFRVGAQFNDYYNLKDKTPGAVAGIRDNEVNPYADANLTYTYALGSYFQAGVRHTHNATDVAGNDPTDPVRDQESTSIYASVTHKITANLTGSLLGQIQHSVFNGGGKGINSQADDFYILGVNLAYHFNPNFIVEAGYNFDDLNSDLPDRSYQRNRAYIGVRATY